MSDAYRLGPEQLRHLRDAALEEILTGVRHGADQATLREIIQVVDEVDARIDVRARQPDTFANRRRVAATRSRPKQGI